jgi:aminoglycoside/choline kinase family phosphotransferase
MLLYDRLAMEAEIGLLTEWYWPFCKGAQPSDDLARAHRDVWNDALALVSAPHMLVLRDYHAENLLWLPHRAGARRVGLLDFQDGLFGAAAYDLVSLLEDARRDVPESLLEAMLDRYAAGAEAQGPFNETEFREDFAILAGQRNAKILGIFARLVRRDGKQKYESLLPRVEGLFRRDLARAPLKAVRAFYVRHFPELVA